MAIKMAPLRTAEDAKAIEFENLKRRIHGKLVDKLDLTKVGELAGDVLRREIRLVVEHLCDTEGHAAQSQRARAAGRRSARRDVRPGPAGTAAEGSDDQRHPDQRAQAHLRGTPRQDGKDQRHVPRQQSLDADHRPHRVEGRPPRGRSLPDGRRPLARRLARERDHSAAGPGRGGGVDSPLRLQSAEAGRPAELQGLHARDGDAAGRGHQGPAEHHHLRRYRLGQNDAAQHAVELHLQHRPHRDDRGRGRIATAAGARRAAGNAAGRTSKARARSRPPTWCATPCVCGPNASSSASAADRKRSTCCRP